MSETWLSCSIIDNEILPTGYSIYHLDRDYRGGGVAIFVKSSISSKLYNADPSLHLECVSVEICCQPSFNLMVSCVYIPPNLDVVTLSSLDDFIKSLPSTHTHLIIGDFNMPNINWSTFSSPSSLSDSFCDLLLESNLSVSFMSYSH